MAQSKKRKRSTISSLPIRRRGCQFCKDNVEEIDWKNTGLLRRYMSERAKIRARRVTGVCRRHQQQLSIAIKRAREMALLPYVSD